MKHNRNTKITTVPGLARDLVVAKAEVPDQVRGDAAQRDEA